MIKTLSNLLQQDKEKYRVPRRVQDVIPIRRIWPDGIFLVGNKYSKMYRFTDINYLVASRADKESMFLQYSELLNSLDAGATAKITINNRRLNRVNFEKNILMPLRGDARDIYRREYNRMLLDKAMEGNGIIQEKYITVTVLKKDIEEARSYFARTGADLCSHFAALGAKCTELDATERLRVLHDFYRVGEEVDFHFDAKDMMQKGHDFRDYICPDSIEKTSDRLKLGKRFCRVLYLKDYASYIKDCLVTELTDLSRNMMLSIDIVPVPTDEAVREVETRLLGVETNITNWQRRQNANNNFSAVIPYDMELQRREAKEFLDDLTTRDQRMMLCVLTMVLTAETQEQLDSDTETVLAITNGNTVIICFNKESTCIEGNINLNLLPKSHFLRAFKSMGLDNAEADALYTTTRGNMRALIRKIPGCTNEDRPDWANLDSLHLLIPITFLRSFHPVRDRKLVEQLSGTSYTVIENKYNELLRLEDSPIKRVGEYYSVIDFESTFTILNIHTSDLAFDRLNAAVLSILLNDAPDVYTMEGKRYADTIFHSLILNYVFFSESENENDKIADAVKSILDYAYLAKASQLVFPNLLFLAMAAPEAVFCFIQAGLEKNQKPLLRRDLSRWFSAKGYQKSNGAATRHLYGSPSTI